MPQQQINPLSDTGHALKSVALGWACHWILMVSSRRIVGSANTAESAVRTARLPVLVCFRRMHLKAWDVPGQES